jgi:hypothetical protein
MRTIKYIISIFFIILISCEKKQTLPKSFIELNKIIHVLKDSAYYYAYYKDWFSTEDTIDIGRIETLKKIFDESVFITSNGGKKLVIATPMYEDNDMIRVYGYKKGVMRKLFRFSPYEYDLKYGHEWKVYNDYIIVHTGKNYGGGSSMFDSYDYIYGFKKDSLTLLDSIVTKHRENEYKEIGLTEVISKSRGSITNWKFISKNCILKEYESGEVFIEPRTDSIIFKPNSKKYSEKKCF